METYRGMDKKPYDNKMLQLLELNPSLQWPTNADSLRKELSGNTRMSWTQQQTASSEKPE